MWENVPIRGKQPQKFYQRFPTTWCYFQDGYHKQNVAQNIDCFNIIEITV